jgi:selenoprotein W-related protein
VLIPDGGGVFDVAVDDELIYSKLQTGSFPDEYQLINELISTHGNK